MPLGDTDHQAQIGLDHLLSCLFVSVGNPLSELSFLAWAEQRHLD